MVEDGSSFNADNRLNTSAAPSWNSAGRSTAESVAAISRISPLHRHAFAACGPACSNRGPSAGCERAHSSDSTSATPSASAAAASVKSSADVPFVHPAYTIFNEAAAYGASSSTTAATGAPNNGATSTDLSPDRNNRGASGPPITPPSTKDAPDRRTIASIAAAVAGAIALAST